MKDKEKELDNRLKALEDNPLFDYLQKKQVLTMKEASVFLDCSISKLYKLTHLKEIPHYKPLGKMIYFDRNELEEWMKTHNIERSNPTLPIKEESKDIVINDSKNNEVMIPRIEMTTEYDKFSLMDENRNIREGKVKNLMKAIQEFDLTPYEPIKVSWRKKIIDGQHRFEACKRLGKPIYYIVLDKSIDAHSAMIMLNQVVSQWRMNDFLNFHAEMQGGRWAEMKEWDEKHNLGLSNTAVLFAEKQMNATQIREGEIQFTKFDKADDVAEFLKSEEVRRLKYHNTRAFVIAVRHAFERYTPRQLSKLKKSLIFIEHKANYEQYLVAFENLIGKKR